MEKEKLINEIIDLCFVLKIFNNSADTKEVKCTVKALLEEAGFIQDLHNTILQNAKRLKIANTKEVTDMLTKLENIKLQVEKDD